MKFETKFAVGEQVFAIMVLSKEKCDQVVVPATIKKSKFFVRDGFDVFLLHSLNAKGFNKVSAVGKHVFKTEEDALAALENPEKIPEIQAKYETLFSAEADVKFTDTECIIESEKGKVTHELIPVSSGSGWCFVTQKDLI